MITSAKRVGTKNCCANSDEKSVIAIVSVSSISSPAPRQGEESDKLISHFHMDAREKIIRFYNQHKRMPSYTEIGELVGYASKNAVSKLVHKLIGAGFLEKDAKGKIRLSLAAGEVPLLGLVEAGIPTTADSDMLDSLSIEEYLIPKKEKTFILEVKGDSMIEAHIDEGDLIIAERAETARDGEIVVAEVDGGWTLKYYKTNGTKAWLEPANKYLKPIHPEEYLRVAAIVRGVIRKY